MALDSGGPTGHPEILRAFPLFGSGRDHRVTAMFAVTRVAPFHPRFPAAVFVLALDLHGLSDPWHGYRPPFVFSSRAGLVSARSTCGPQENPRFRPLRNARSRAWPHRAQA
jgi:hypothetical protein